LITIDGDPSKMMGTGISLISMHIHRHPWMSLDINGYPSRVVGYMISMHINGYPWMSMHIHGYPLISMDVMDIHGYP
jgi:hypothetical protein